MKTLSASLCLCLALAASTVRAACLSAALKALPLAVVVLNSGGLIVEVNDEWIRLAKLNGFRPDDFGIGLNYLEICRGCKGEGSADGRAVARALEKLLAGTESGFDHVYAVAGAKPRWYSVQGYDFTDGGNRMIALVHKDITQQDAAERVAALESLLQAVGRLADGVAHGVLNKLTTAKGFLELAKRASHEDERVRYLGQAEAAYLELQALIENFRRLSPGPVPAGPLDLTTSVNEALALFERPNGVRFAGTLERAGTVGVSAGQLFIALDALVRNALTSMEKAGGVLTVDLAPVRFDEPALTDTGSLAPGAYGKLTVSDTGVGMSAATRQQLFEPVVRSGHHLGFGLSRVHQVATGVVKGGITVRSEVGQGTSVDVYFPLIEVTADSQTP